MGILESSAKKVDYVKMVKEGPDRKAQMIFTGLTYIVAVLLIVFAIVPTFQTVQQVDSEIKEKEKISAALRDKLAALTSLDDQYNSNKETFDDLSLVYPTSQNFSLFLANIDAIVTRNNFILKSIGFSDYKKSRRTGGELDTKALIPSSVRLTVSGSKVYLITFLKDLEALPMYPIVESISYSNEVDEEGNTDYSISLGVYQIENVNFYE